MKKIITLIIFNLALFGVAFAKSPFREFDKAREIILLQSTRDDVKRILAGYKSNDNNSQYSQTFSNENAKIKVRYSNGESCSEEDSEAVWNVSEWKVTRIDIYPKVPLKLEELNINSANFQKEKKYANVDDTYVYHNKSLGIAFEIDEDDIDRIFIFPTVSNYSLLCSNELAEEFKAFYTNESFFTVPDIESRIYQIPGNPAPVIDKIILSATEIIIGCDKTAENKGWTDSDRMISVETVANDKENDVLTFSYTVSGGKIVGTGAKVTWDLTGVGVGTYTITVGADDGCGICAPTRSETVVVKKYSDCSPK